MKHHKLNGMLTGYLIKPEAMNVTDEIRKDIRANGLEIIIYKKIILSENDIETIYREVDAHILQATKNHMASKEVEIGILRGEKALERFYRLVGKEGEPKSCEDGTLRKKYGKPTIFIEDKPFFLNAIHRPIDENEADHFLEWCFQFFTMMELYNLTKSFEMLY